jgi:hypothetical protein
MTVEMIPAGLPPMRELKKTVGKKRNQTNGLMIDQNCHCTQQVPKGRSRANTIHMLLFLLASIVSTLQLF